MAAVTHVSFRPCGLIAAAVLALLPATAWAEEITTMISGGFASTEISAPGRPGTRD